MYIHIVGGLRGLRSAVVLLSRGRAHSRHPGRMAGASLLMLGRQCSHRWRSPEEILGQSAVEARSDGQVGPGAQRPCGEVWAGPIGSDARLRAPDPPGAPCVRLLTPLLLRGRGSLAPSPPALLVPDTSTEKGLWRKGGWHVPRPVPGKDTDPALEGRAHMPVSSLASCLPPTAGPWPGPDTQARASLSQVG